ncbi:MAG: insulinase family protein [Treponema sp.]|nr:insulinase family protein [Treponema sp.]
MSVSCHSPSTMKKLLSVVLTCIFLSVTFAFSPKDIQSFTLENGMRIFVLSDTTAAPVRLELDIQAGYASQTERTAGFFPLYARLLGADISADMVRIVKTVAPQESEYAIMELASCLRPLGSTTLTSQLDDATLRAALNKMKAEVAEYAKSTAGFINTAIDSRIFPSAPWKVESGVYPALFSATTISSARAILSDIGTQFYTPQKSVLYISGNITVAAAYDLAKKHFAPLKAHTMPAPSTVSVQSAPAVQKYVLTDDEFTADMTQIVLQYTHLSADEADCAAAVMNNDFSTYKKQLLAEKSLAIFGAEYINVASAQKHGSSRLIIQSLLEKTKASPCAQAETFLRLTKNNSLLTADELQFALNRIAAEFRHRADDSSALMELLSGWTALFPGDSINTLFSRNQRMEDSISAPMLESFLHTQEPAVFVLVNAKTFAKYAKEFKKAGYQTVTRKNGSWYVQELYRQQLAQKQTEQTTAKTAGQTDLADAASRFIAENKANFSSFTLDNGIPVTVKQTPGAKTTAFALTIRGGELLFAKESPGLCSVLTDAIAVNIRHSLDERTARGLLTGDSDVRAKTYANCSVLTVTCAAEEAEACTRAISEALIYGDITPAMADGITYDERTQWRIKSGAATFQLLCSAMRTLYAKEPYVNLFDDTADKPVKTDFTHIAAAYPILLDSSRFSLIVAGGISDGDALKHTLNETFGALLSQKETASIDATVAKPTMPRRIKRIQLRHLFLTDISADKAGPRPAVLVPTKNFNDPTLYCIPSPDLSSTDIALFNALLYEIAERMQTKLGGDIKLRTDIPDYDFPFARLYAQNVTQISKIDNAYLETIAELTEDLQTLVNAKHIGVIDTEKDRLLATMENRWLMNTLSATGTALGTAELIQTGTSFGKASLYLDQYSAVDKAKAEDYFILMKFYFADIPDFRVYSIDSKR